MLLNLYYAIIPVYFYTFIPLCHYTCIPLYFYCTFIPAYIYSFISLYLYSYIPLYLYTFLLLCHYTCIPHLYTFIPLYLYTFIPFYFYAIIVVYLTYIPWSIYNSLSARHLRFISSISLCFNPQMKKVTTEMRRLLEAVTPGFLHQVSHWHQVPALQTVWQQRSPLEWTTRSRRRGFPSVSTHKYVVLLFLLAFSNHCRVIFFILIWLAHTLTIFVRYGFMRWAQRDHWIAQG